jgi:hypothetical protein
MHSRSIKYIFITTFIFLTNFGYNQVIINEGSNKNFNSITDEDSDYEDWIELYNSGNEPINLSGYSLTDNNNPTQWTFPEYTIEPGEFLIVFCSGKNRYIEDPFHHAAHITNYTPSVGWNTHAFETPFIWDGASNILLDVCAYSLNGTSANSIFYQSQMGYISTLYSLHDFNDSPCSALTGAQHVLRPNTQFNDVTVGNNTMTNQAQSYPAPYGNSKKCSRHQFLYRANELLAAGLTAGPIYNLSWNVAETGNDFYTSLDFALKHVPLTGLTTSFDPKDGHYFHTNFGISSSGETIRLIHPEYGILDELHINIPVHEVSIGRPTDGNSDVTFLSIPTPRQSNSSAQSTEGLLGHPIFSLPSGVYPQAQQITISSGSLQNVSIYYTTNGDEPTTSSALYTGESIDITTSTALRARAYAPGFIPSKISAASYLIGVSHHTPILSVIVDNDHLYGSSGIFEHWQHDWEKFAQMSFFDSTALHQIVFEKDVAMQIDGGGGGSRYPPKHSFRLEMGKSALGETDVSYPVLSNRPERTEYNRLYFRNGSNYWIKLPYKDGCLVELMANNTKSYYSAMRPVSVYLNGEYFGLYEMREKLDQQYYEIYDNQQDQEIDLLSVSIWNNSVLKAIEGSHEDFLIHVSQIENLSPSSPTFLDEMGSLFDLENLTDYIIGQSWISNSDWPQNNIKIHRSQATNNRWRFSTVDLELSLNPEGLTNCQSNGLHRALTYHPNTYLTPWRRCMQNTDYFNSFVSRFADLMNTNYRIERLLEVEERYYQEWRLEMPNEYARWIGEAHVEGWMAGFFDRHMELQDDLICKSEVMFDQVENTLHLDGQLHLTLQTIPAYAGVIHLNSITPTTYPWTGIYYKGIPIQLTAVANEGYEFTHWVDNGLFDDTLIASWMDAVDLDAITFTAVFENTVSIDEPKSITSSIRIYPNPAKDILYIDSKEQHIAHWKIHNALGEVMSESTRSVSGHPLQVNISDYPSGVYFINVKYEGGRSENKRWVKN